MRVGFTFLEVGRHHSNVQTRTHTHTHTNRTNPDMIRLTSPQAPLTFCRSEQHRSTWTHTHFSHTVLLHVLVCWCRRLFLWVLLLWWHVANIKRQNLKCTQVVKLRCLHRLHWTCIHCYHSIPFYSKVRSEAGLHAILYLHLIILQQNENSAIIFSMCADGKSGEV